MQLRVLVIDRSEELAHFVRVCLTRYWPQAKIEAYLTLYGLPPEKFDWSVYQLVVIEHRLGPGAETAFDLLRTIRARHPALPVVMLTTEGNEAIAVRAFKLGVAQYLNFEDRTTLTEIIHAHSRGSIPQLPPESRRYQPIVDGLLAKDPDERFQSAAEALTGIEWVERSS